MLTRHWFLVVLAEVDQVPQSWVELFHHILAKGEKQLVISSFEVLIIMLLKHWWVNMSTWLSDITCEYGKPCWLLINRSYDDL